MSFLRPLPRNFLPPLTYTFRPSTVNLRIVAGSSRSLATVVPDSKSISVDVSSSGERQGAKEGALRPHLGITVDPNHGLYGFFRRNVDKDGTVQYETIDPRNAVTDNSGRSWTAPELRRKSFQDLHTLWYVLLRERNLLATQNEEVRRLGSDVSRTPNILKAHRIRKSMARIKYVINERRLAYEGAVKIHEERRLAVLAEKYARREELKAAQAAKESPDTEDEKVVTEGDKAAELAASALFDAVSTGSEAGKQA